MKFIFPQNYNFKNKLFGIFDYTTILVNILWSAFILIIINEIRILTRGEACFVFETFETKMNCPP